MAELRNFCRVMPACCLIPQSGNSAVPQFFFSSQLSRPPASRTSCAERRSLCRVLVVGIDNQRIAVEGRVQREVFGQGRDRTASAIPLSATLGKPGPSQNGDHWCHKPQP